MIGVAAHGRRTVRIYPDQGDPAGVWGKGVGFSGRLTCGGHVSFTGASADASLATALHAGCLCKGTARTDPLPGREQLRDRGCRRVHPHAPPCDNTKQQDAQHRGALTGCTLNSGAIAVQLGALSHQSDMAIR